MNSNPCLISPNGALPVSETGDPKISRHRARRALQGACNPNPSAAPQKHPARGSRRAPETSNDARSMLFGLYKDACSEQGWSASDAAQRQEVTRDALGLRDDQAVPSWSALDKDQITALKSHLGKLAYNLAATMADAAALAKRQALWSIEASARAMCNLGPVDSEAPDANWAAYVNTLVADISQGRLDDFRQLPLASPDCVDLRNFAKALHNRLHRAARKARAAGRLHTSSLNTWMKTAKAQAMANHARS